MRQKTLYLSIKITVINMIKFNINIDMAILHLYISKAIRSFFNGVIGAFLIYFFFYNLNFHDPSNISLMIFAALLSGIVKSKIIISFHDRKEVIKSILLAYVSYLGPLMAFVYFHLVKSTTLGITFIVIIAIGFFPVDGQDTIFFEQIEQKYLCNGKNIQLNNSLQIYARIGYIFQAIGSFFSLFYLSYQIQQVYYELQPRVRSIINLCLFIALINIAFYTFFQLQELRKTNEPIAQRQDKPSLNAVFNDKKLKMLSLVDGFAAGLFPAPFIAYYFDLKFNFFLDSVGLILLAFFMLRGIGEDFMNKYPDYQILFKRWSILSNILLIVIALIPEPSLSVVCLIFAFPAWNYCKNMRKKYMCSCSNNQMEITHLNKNIYWEKSGAALGILVSSFFFSILSTKLYFGYPLLLCGIVGLVNTILTNNLLHKFEGESRVFSNLQESGDVQANQIMQQDQPSLATAQNVRGQKESKIPTKSYIFYAFLALVFFSFFKIYASSCYYTDTCYLFMLRSDPVVSSPNLKLFNESLAHFLVRQNATNVKLVNCDQSCIKEHREKREKHYQLLRYDSTTPQWLHFSKMTYFSSQQEVENELNPILLENPSVKGFSVIWAKSLPYNKMPSQIDGFLIALSEKHGFYYAQMPSLNLRGVENRVIMIFTRERRKQVGLPSFVKKQPPKNILAVEATFKLVTHYRYLREYFIYHLNLGVDKFILYDNNRAQSDPTFYQEYHGIGKFLRKCFNATFDEQYAIFEDIWSQFYDHIVYIPWRIKHYHPQEEGHLHYGSYFRKVVKFTIYTDLDEYLYIPSGKYVPDTLQGLLGEHVTALLFESLNFKSRTCLNKQLAVEQYRWLHQPKSNLTVKSIVLTKVVLDHAIHGKSVKNGRFAYVGDERHDIGMIHYKISAADPDLGPGRIYTTNYSMKPYVEGLKEACKGKCSDSMNLTCSEQQYAPLKQQFCKEQ